VPPDPRDLAGDFVHRREVVVRFADTDAMGHVNNAVYLTYCETARIMYWTDVTGEPIGLGTREAESLILADAHIAYRSPTLYGETVTIETRAARIGRTSFVLEHRLTARPVDGPPRLVATSGSVLVRYDYAREAPIPLPEPFIAAIEAFEGRRLREDPPAIGPA
jgi:acyl-CoA thioester hydrolase